MLTFSTHRIRRLCVFWEHFRLNSDTLARMKVVRPILVLISGVLATQCFGEGFRAIFFHGTGNVPLSSLGFVLFSIYPLTYLIELEERKK